MLVYFIASNITKEKVADLHLSFKKERRKEKKEVFSIVELLLRIFNIIEHNLNIKLATLNSIKCYFKAAYPLNSQHSQLQSALSNATLIFPWSLITFPARR